MNPQNPSGLYDGRYCSAPRRYNPKTCNSLNRGMGSKNSKKNGSEKGNGKNSDRTAIGEVNLDNDVASSEPFQTLGVLF
jgi:hypothetical protein